MNKKRLAAFGIVTCGALLIYSAAFTLAWYTGSSNLGVNDFEIKMSGKELEISHDNINWKNSLTAEDLGIADPLTYKPVSSAFSYDWMSRKETAPKFVDGYPQDNHAYNLTSLDYAHVANGGYLSTEIYVKCTAAASISFDPDVTKVMADEQENQIVANKLAEKYPDLTTEDILSNLNQVRKSLRFSILVLNDTDKEASDPNYLEDYDYFIVDPYKENDTYLGGLLDNDLDGYFDSFGGKEVLYGEVRNANDGTMVYTPNSSSASPSTSHSCFDASHKEGVEKLDIDASSLNGMEIAKEGSLSLADATEMRIPLKANVSKRLILSVYMEGWDTDNVAYTMYSRFISIFGFTLTS